MECICTDYATGDLDELCPVHFPGLRWLPTWANNAVRYWRVAARDPEQGQLTFRQWGDYRRRHVEHGWWLTPTLWGLGVELSDDWHRYPYTGQGGQFWATVQVGPLAWSIGLHQPHIDRPPRPVEPIQWDT